MTLELGVWAREFASCGRAARAQIWLCVCLAVVLVSAEVAPQEATLWQHNGSIVALSATGARRQFHYRTPSADLLEIGVQPRTLLFDGRRDRDKYTGTAYVFSRVCGALPYAVAGPVSPDQRAVTMYGKAPVVDSSCRVLGHRDDVLVFSLSSIAQTNTGQSDAEQIVEQRPPNQQAHDIEYERFLQHWQACFGGAQNTDAGISACDSALSIQRGSVDDRIKLWQRRLELIGRWKQLTGKEPIGDQRTTSSNPNSAAGTRSCGSGCSWCDTTTGVCLIPSDGPRPAEGKTTSFREENKRSAFNPMSDAAFQSVVALVAAAILIGFLWVRYGLESARSEVSLGTAERSEVLPDQAARMFDASMRAHAADQTPLTSGGARARNSPELDNHVLPPSQPMALKLKRSERLHLTGKVVFMLDARMDLNAEAHALVKKYRLGNRIVYESQARERHRNATKEHLESTRDQPSWSDGMNAQLLGVGKTFYRLARASVSATMAALSLRITVDSLIRGEHVECESMDELIEAERAVKEAATNLKGYLEEAATFDGREEVVEF
ncbi:hypothetical protein LUI11_32200 [Bradyrhizobium diazoefficiens]|uniref:Transmembrane protein n=2 Tax=Bradyrhizobium diazoefficiens TaxID=1355477 RepID=A0A837C949_9BRAD|nr:hypothetical protein [Bradyrhizobium diazoefficiens]KGJ65548.1 hypothetical protein BJA5080_02194 [Bradyrhizobium diazoefficiens SEMIA 5080]MCD9296234.1 hypothetical protein [Bradyrhizobium diazoefficiens]MCD9813042.1 hypothetical protein [Bradyrhizobium diazoefficiens]MCD9831767.1 hypothetical protein [Bradyrhizobium diazoefficiens]MCD9849851.1 hypothetical protein [Bradyrhizobium diazoefficiens]